MISITSRLPPKSSSILACHKFIKWAILVTSAPAAASLYACLVILACDILGSTRGNANAWHVAWGKLGGKTMSSRYILHPFFFIFDPFSSPFLRFILFHSSNLHSTTSHSFRFISPPLPQDIQIDCKTMKRIFN